MNCWTCNKRVATWVDVDWMPRCICCNGILIGNDSISQGGVFFKFKEQLSLEESKCRQRS